MTYIDEIRDFTLPIFVVVIFIFKKSLMCILLLDIEVKNKIINSYSSKFCYLFSLTSKSLVYINSKNFGIF